MIKAVIFDLDDTLYSFTRGHQAGMQALEDYTVQRLSIDREAFRLAYDKAMEQINDRLGRDVAAAHNRLIRFQHLLTLLSHASPSMAFEMYQIYWNTLIEDIEPEPGLCALLHALAREKIILGVGSDMTSYMQYRKLKDLGILDLLDFVVVSEDAGADKPAPCFFELCVKRAGVLPGECVFIGDSYEKDVEGAVHNGLHGVWYRPQGDIPPEIKQIPVIRSYRDCLKEHQICLGSDLVIPVRP